MKFGIFICGDNHPELGRSNLKYYEDVMSMAYWAEELGFDSYRLLEKYRDGRGFGLIWREVSSFVEAPRGLAADSGCDAGFCVRRGRTEFDCRADARLAQGHGENRARRKRQII
jgi:hypothetical protein